MSDLIRASEWRKARKPHQCIACYAAIEVGENYREQTGYWDGKAFRNRFHSECFDVLREEGEGEFSPGSFEVPERLTSETKNEGYST